MDTWGHIFERFFIHFFSATGIVLAVSTLLRFAKRKKRYSWIPSTSKNLVMLAALIVFAVAVLREAHDVAAGGWVVKSYFDYASWALGAGVGAWGLIRFDNWS